ncbi:hypothetical protein CNEO2_10141 [Clostridium neonatale]|nr:hypothetical protein CNEO2_10141 [Clostridium neonatale]
MLKAPAIFLGIFNLVINLYNGVVKISIMIIDYSILKYYFIINIIIRRIKNELIKYNNFLYLLNIYITSLITK